MRREGDLDHTPPICVGHTRYYTPAASTILSLVELLVTRKRQFSRYQLTTISNLSDFLVRCTGLLQGEEGGQASDHNVGKIANSQSWCLEKHLFLIPEPAGKLPLYLSLPVGAHSGREGLTNASAAFRKFFKGGGGKVKVLRSTGVSLAGCE